MKLASMRSLVTLYPGASIKQRAYMLGRLALCPFDRIVEEMPDLGQALDYGCGAGLWLNLLAREKPGLDLTGIDIDERKIKLAELAPPGRAQFLVSRSGDEPPAAAYDVITCIDVLYLMPPVQAASNLAWMYNALKPGGKLVLKEASDTPRLKYLLTRFQEFLAVHVLRFTAGANVCIKSLDDQVALVREAGFFNVNIRRIDQGYPYPAVLITAAKPDD